MNTKPKPQWVVNKSFLVWSDYYITYSALTKARLSQLVFALGFWSSHALSHSSVASCFMTLASVIGFLLSCPFARQRHKLWYDCLFLLQFVWDGEKKMEPTSGVD